MVKKQNENQRSIANIVLEKTKTWHLHFVSALLFGALFVSYMVRSKKWSKGRNRRKETSAASNWESVLFFLVS